MTDLADLRAKAEAATPGPWETNDPGIVIFPEWGGWLAEEDTENQEADAAYIAAASPQTILRLLDLLTPEALADAMEADGWEFPGDPVLSTRSILDRLTERQAPR